jgi:hypothetical protein
VESAEGAGRSAPLSPSHFSLLTLTLTFPSPLSLPTFHFSLSLSPLSLSLPAHSPIDPARRVHHLLTMNAPATVEIGSVVRLNSKPNRMILL